MQDSSSLERPSGTIKILYAPWKEVVLHEAIQYTVRDLLRMQSLGVQTGGLAAPLLWASGIIFAHEGMPAVKDVIEEQLQGRIHWSSVRFVVMREFMDHIIVECQVTVPIVDVSTNPTLKTAADWICTTILPQNEELTATSLVNGRGMGAIMT